MDIVERLRREEDALDNEAADEIERLREALDTIIEKNKPEIERANLHFKMLEDEVRGYNRMLDAYEEENERLREALSYCACTCAKSCGKHIEHDGEIAFVECSGWVARSALQQKESE